MNWKRKNYSLISDKGYTVGKYMVSGKWVYVAWSPQLVRLGHFYSADEAKAECERAVK